MNNIKKSDLLKDLKKLRNNLRDNELLVNNTSVNICTNEALEEMTNKMPLKISDFLAISGTDKNFMKSYAPFFLQKINEFRGSQNIEVKVSDQATEVLHHYKDRLTNISKTNPNLYMGKIEKVRSFDITELNQNEEIINLLNNPKSKELKLKLKDKVTEDAMTTLYRATNKDLRETGSYNLYIAYPYVEGTFEKEKFPIKAPLLYFPIKLERKRREFVIIKDNEKDIILNRDLLLLSSKIESQSLDMDMPSVNNINADILKDKILPYYETNDIVVKLANDHNFNEFINYFNELKDDFMKREHQGFIIKNYITMGRYQPYSSMIQKDVNSILAKRKYNELLDGLIGEENLYKEEYRLLPNLPKHTITESKLTYINDLNDAQETVIEMLNKEKKLVIWGPPGTGKSQTITSLIASSILKGENVLVVSEKKVALDVIYSRLGSASKYAMFVDDAENKQGFYNKLKGFLESSPVNRTINNEIYSLEEEITEITKKLDQSLNLLYGPNNTGVTVDYLYNRYLKDREIIEELTPLKVYEIFVKYFSDLNFEDLEKIEETFDNNRFFEDYLMFQEALNKYPLLSQINTKITRSGKIELDLFNREFEKLKSETKSLKKGLKNKKIKEFITNNSMRLEFLTINKKIDNSYLKLLFKDETLNSFVYEYALKIDKLFTKHNQLTKNDLRFLNMFLYDNVLNKIEDKNKLRKYLFDAYYTGYIENFKTKHQDKLHVIDDYLKNIERLNELIDNKKRVTIESFELELYRYALNLGNTRRIMDIRRILDSPKRPSIKAFIDIFQPEMMENIKIWMMTPEVVSTIIPLLYGMFDLVIFDEASQMYVEKGIPAIYRAKKVVIAGDPKQLRPSSLGFGRISDDDTFYEDETLNNLSLDAKSLLDLARYKYPETLLNYHYRSKYEELINFSNHAFYDGKLIVAPNQEVSVKPPIEYMYIENGIFKDRKNHEEAKAVVEIIKKVLRQRKNNESIGVITFNSSQRDLIESYIDKELFTQGVYQKRFEKELFRSDDGEDKSLFVKNIENVQGDERDIIIFSMGYSKDSSGKVQRRFGWLNHEGGQNRLNVAITRAKEKIYFVSSLYPEELHVEDLSSEGPKLLKDFMRYCYYVSNKRPELAKTVLDQLNATEQQTHDVLITRLADEVKQRLERSNYKVKSSIGIGSYNISLAVYDETTNEYLLGIICDISNIEETNARAELLHQERYLRSRNWNIYRVFGANWYQDPNKEMRNIREAIKKS